MSVWVSLFLSVFATVGLFATLYFVIVAVVEGKRNKAKPRLGACPAETSGNGQLGFWVKWDPKMFLIEFYRIRVSFYAPESEVKEGLFTVTLDPTQKEGGFVQYVELPEQFVKLLTEEQKNRKAVITVDFRTTDNFVVAKNYLLAQLKDVYLGKKNDAPKDLAKLELVKQDVPAVSTLEFGELVERRKKLKQLADEAKAKAAKAKPAAAPAAATAAAPAPAPVETPVPEKAE